MKLKKDQLDKPWVAYTVAICSGVLLFLTLSNLTNLLGFLKGVYRIISPLVIGLVVAYIVNPFVKLLRNTVLKGVKKSGLKTNLSVFLAIIIIFLVIGLLMIALIPQVIFSVQTFVTNLDSYIVSLQELLQSASLAAAERNIDISGITSLGDNFLDDLSSSVPKNFGNIVATGLNISKALFNLMIGLFLAIYFLLDKERLQIGLARLLKRLLKEKKYRAFASFWDRCNAILVRYIAFDIIDGIIVAVVNFIFMSIMSMPYAVLVSVVVGITNLAPTFGPMVGGAIGAFIIVLVNPGQALWFMLFTIVLQTIDGYILKPKLFGGTLGIPGVWILVAIIVGGRIFGVTGILLAIPFTAIVDFIYKDFIFKVEVKEDKKE